MPHPAIAFAPSPAERRARGGLGVAVLAVHGAVMALALQGGAGADPRRPPPSAAEQATLLYIRLPALADGMPAMVRPRARDEPRTPSAAPPAQAIAKLTPPPGSASDTAVLLAVSFPASPASTAAAGRSELHGASADNATHTTAAANTPGATLATAARALAGNALPAYPEAAREDALQGSVQLWVQIDATGRVTAVQWLHRSGVLLLDLAARDAVRGWRFEPARQGGQAVAGTLALAIRFQLDAPAGPVSVDTLAARTP